MEFKEAKRIWIERSAGEDNYGEFFDTVEYSGGKTVLGISCDGNYALYVNGELASCGQYADFPWYKVYDEIDMTKYLRGGKNELRIVVWHYGTPNSSVY